MKNQKIKQPIKKSTTEGVRINKYLADHNYASRRESDAVIKRGLVKINGHVAQLGDRVFEGDKVDFAGGKKIKENKYFVYYKPIGVETNLSRHAEPAEIKAPRRASSRKKMATIKKYDKYDDGKKETDIKQIGGFTKDFFPVGRLDKDSHGIIIVTNDGRITGKLLEPEYEHEKEYRVKVDKDISHLFLKLMANGIKLEDFTTKPAIVSQVDERTFDITLTEGKKHQIRRMCAALGYQVRDLKRTRI